ncbi:MAG: TIGR03943 family protein [Chloroflexi bacterium]|nr:TIGR03943 family protein [Chloroflexota bacterium]
MSARDSRITWAKLLILLGMGVYLTQLIISGNLSNYINQRFGWLAYVGAGIFFLLALVSLWGRMKPSLHLHQHYRIGWDIVLIAAFPLALAVLIPSRSLGIEAINGGISLRPVGVGNAATFARSPLDRNILDWLREFNRAAPAEFNELPVDVTGFVYREPQHAADEFMVSRFTMSCCVADAFPIGMPARADSIDEVTVGSWVRVQGRLNAAKFAGELLPVIAVESLELVDEPDQPYLYP